MTTIIVDTGPLVALSDRRDHDFRACTHVMQMEVIRYELVTSWAAVAEAMYLLDSARGARDRLFALLQPGMITIDTPPRDILPRIQQLMTRYADLPMDFADATIVELAERLDSDTVFTLDERDFHIYQPRHRPHFRLLPADLYS